MCLRADATTSAIHVRLILPGECHGRLPARLCHTPFTRIWPHEELCRFSALVDNPWKWCASCWRKIALVLKNSLRRRVLLSGEFLPIRVFLLLVVAYALAIAGCALMLRNRTSRFRFCATAAR